MHQRTETEQEAPKIVCTSNPLTFPAACTLAPLHSSGTKQEEVRMESHLSMNAEASQAQSRAKQKQPGLPRRNRPCTLMGQT